MRRSLVPPVDVVYSLCSVIRIYTVHDEVKDKMFELEMSWVREGQLDRSHLERGGAYWGESL